jgi:hypothetical protein
LYEKLSWDFSNNKFQILIPTDCSHILCENLIHGITALNSRTIRIVEIAVNFSEVQWEQSQIQSRAAA